MLSHLELIHKAYYIRNIAIFCGNADYTNFLATVTIGIKCLKTSDLGWQWHSLSKVNTLVQSTALGESHRFVYLTVLEASNLKLSHQSVFWRLFGKICFVAFSCS